MNEGQNYVNKDILKHYNKWRLFDFQLSSSVKMFAKPFFAGATKSDVIMYCCVCYSLDTLFSLCNGGSALG